MSVVLAVIGVVCLLNLALLFAVTRKVRVLSERVDKMPVMAPAALLPVGSKAPEFIAVTTTGESRSLADLAGSRSVVGFFSPGCEPCRTQLPKFAEFARALPGGSEQALAVVLGQTEAAAGLAADLHDAAAVVMTPRQDPLPAAFSVKGTPAFYLIGPDGRIEARGMAVQALASAVAA
jgi:thiol-disulfide isomerase/thioredoxin